MSDRPESLHVGQILAGYRLEGQVGRGGFAKVLRARRLSDQVQVALKVLRSKHLGQFRAERQLLREARILKGLHHPQIVRCLEFGRAGPWVYLAMPLIEGEPLSLTLARGPLPRADALEIGVQVLTALDYLHGKGVVHQDVKPDNVLRSAGGACTLLDFGLAMTREDVLVGRTGAGPGRVSGTGSYRAPEQAEPKGIVGTASDLFAFGVTLHRICTGELLRCDEEADSARPELEALAAHLSACVRRDPQARPSARALRRELEALRA